MRGLYETLELTLFLALVFGIVFLFEGEPDVWDSLRASVTNKCVQGEK